MLFNPYPLISHQLDISFTEILTANNYMDNELVFKRKNLLLLMFYVFRFKGSKANCSGWPS